MVFSILLLLITSLYVLPVKETFANVSAICMTDMEEKEENNKKEKIKELFSCSNSYMITEDTYKCTHQHTVVSIPAILHTIETPPPDLG